MKPIVCGIDYSMTSPCICVHDGSSSMDFDSCSLFYLSKQTKLVDTFRKNIHGNLYPDYSSEMERYMKIAKWSMDIIQEYDVTHVYLEGYSMGSKGKVFNIAENTALLKAGIFLAQIPLETVPPTVIKKFASSKGNANKELMYESFTLATGIDLQEIITPNRTNIGNPVSDIVDAYYICKYGWDKLSEN